MNLSTAIFLVNKAVRSVRVSYDPDSALKNNPNRLFKTFDPSIKAEDYVVVPTETRHKFTVCRVEDVGFTVNFDGNDRFDWIVGKVDKPAYDSVIEQEKVVLDKIGRAEENRKRKELAESMQLGDIDFTDLDITRSRLAAPRPASIYGDDVPEAPPAPKPHRERPVSKPDDLEPF